MDSVLDALGLPEQPDTIDWVELLYPRELNARRSRKRKADGGLGYASSAPPTTFSPMPGPEDKVQLAVGFIIRTLESASKIDLFWRDTSRCGIAKDPYKPDFTGFVNHAEVWTTVGAVMEVKESLKGEKTTAAWGQIAQRVEEQFSAQPSRRDAVALAVGKDFVDVVLAKQQQSGIVTYRHSKEQGLSLNRKSLGLQHLVAVITASAEASGYRTMTPPTHMPKHCMYAGHAVPLKFAAYDEESPILPRGTQVYQVKIRKQADSEPEPAILKICSSSLIKAEVENLDNLEKQGLDDRSMRVAESGDVQENSLLSFLLLQPVGKLLTQDEDAMTIMKLGRGLVETVELWHDHGLLHRDLSVSNVGLADDGKVLIWDFSTMARMPARPEQPGHLTGNPLYMAISVQQGAASTLSTELESIFYILVKLSSQAGVMHWQGSWPGDTDAKVAAMMDTVTYSSKVLQRTRDELRPLVEALHDLFFPPASSFVAGPGTPPSMHKTGSFYRTDVSAEEFLDILASCEKELERQESWTAELRLPSL